ENYLFQLDDFIHMTYELNLQLSNQFNEIIDGSHVNGQNIDDIIVLSKGEKFELKVIDNEMINNNQ
ncbi:unnamed protein product, partial [Didymodactylos carnosus]